MEDPEFVKVLESALQPDTESIKNATAKLKEYYKKPESLVYCINVLGSHENEQVRQLAAVEARTLVPTFWPATPGKESPLPANIKDQLRKALLESAVNEPSPKVKHSSARVISAIAKIDLPQDLWLELPNFLHGCATSQKAADREMGVYVLYTLIETLEGKFSDRWSDFFSLFAATINDSESLKVRLNTLFAITKMADFIIADDDPDSVRNFRNLMPAMVEVLKVVIENGEETMTHAAFEAFVGVLITDPALLSNHFGDLMQFMMELASSTNFNSEVRLQAFNFLITAVQHKKGKVQQLKLGEALTTLSLRVAAEPSSGDDSLDEKAPSHEGLALLSFLSEALPTSQVVVPLMNALPQYFQSQEPEHRRAALDAVGACVMGSPDFILSQIETLVPVASQLLADSEQKVRIAALRTISSMADELREDFSSYHAQLIPKILVLMGSDGNKEVWRMCSLAIESIISDVPQSDVVTYLPQLMPGLMAIFGQDDLKLRAAAIAAISATAKGAKEAFQPYFKDTMAALEPCLSYKDSEDELNVRCVVIECMGSLAEAVGPEAFGPYVQPLMQSVREALGLDESGLREASFLFYSTMARVYKEEFAPFLEAVMPLLFESMDQPETDPEDDEDAEDYAITKVGGAPLSLPLKLSKADDEMYEDDTDEDDWEELTAVTAIALEKEMAIDAVGEIVSFCTKAFIPYFEKTISTLVDKTQHAYEGVRKSAVDSLWRSYGALYVASQETMGKFQPGLPLKQQPPKELEQVGQIVMKTTIKLAKDEDHRDVMTAICNNMAEVLKMSGPYILADSDGSNILEVMTIVQLILTKKHACQIDELGDILPDLNENSEYDWYLIESAMDLVLGLAHALGPSFGDAWKIIGQNVVKYTTSVDSIERSHSIGVIAEAIKHMGNAITPHTASVMKIILDRLSDEDPETRSNASFAMGWLCFNSQDAAAVTKEYPNILRKLEPLLRNQGHRTIDNASGCVSRMIMAHVDAVPLQDVLNALIAVLPLKEDFEENEPIYAMFNQLYKSHNQTVFSMTPQLLPIFNSVLSAPEDDSQLLPETKAQVIEILRFLQQNEPGILAQYPVLQAHTA